jgi:predicted ABC-type ATPase
LRKCKAQGYQINLIYVWLESAELAVNRVAKRVASGGHNIPEDIIRRRYERGRRNFVELYLPLADCFQTYDNSSNNTSLVAYNFGSNQEIVIIKLNIWNQIINN